MKLRKKLIVNSLFIVGILVFVFTPLGFQAKVFISKHFAGSASPLGSDKQITLGDYSWQIVDANGASLNVENKRGQVVLINFWATWCPPCVAEMPSFQKLFRDYGDEVTFLFVAEDEPEKVNEFLKKKEYSLPVYYSTSQAPADLVAPSIPKTYIIDKEGKIVVNKTGAANWNSAAVRLLLDDLLKQSR